MQLKSTIGLKVDRNLQLDGDVAPHVEDAPPAIGRIDGQVLQPADVALVYPVEEIVARKEDARHLASINSEVGSCRYVEQSVRRCGCFGPIDGIIVVLSQVAFHLHRHVGIGEGLPISYDVVAQVGSPSWCRCIRQVFAVVRLVELHAVSPLRLSVTFPLREPSPLSGFAMMAIHTDIMSKIADILFNSK